MKIRLAVCFASGLALAALPIVLSACGGPEGEAASTETSESALSSHTRFNAMHMHQPGAIRNQSAPSGAHLNYYGGPTLTHVNVIPVYWNSSVQFQTNLNAFYSAVPNSVLFDMLAQYSGIGRGARGTPYVDNRTATRRVTDTQIHTELTRLINAGLIPHPTASTYYPVHFPPGQSITSSDGTRSCVVWCAYHGTYVLNGVNVNYGVIPDQGGGCAGGCGNNSQRVNNLTSVSSHEMVEAVTDPAVGLATVYGPPLAWYDPTYGEIGDICNGQQGTITGGDGASYVVQQEFSNSANNCVTH